MYLQGIYQDPGAVLQNTIQPVTDTVVALNLKRHSAGQTAAHLQWGDETGALQGEVAASGHLVVGNPAISPVFDAAFQVHGKSTGAFFSPDCNTTYLCEVDPTDHSWFGAIFFQAFNPLAPTPASGFFQLVAFGRLDNAGLRTDYGFAVTDGVTNQNAVQFEGGPQQRAAFGLQADTFLPMVYDGQVDVQSRSDATKGLTVAAFSPTQTANLTEWQNSARAVQTAIAANGRDFILDTTTGTKWGTAVGQKQGWYGATPVVQQANASQTTITSVLDVNAKAALQSIYNALKTLGLCAATA